MNVSYPDDYFVLLGLKRDFAVETDMLEKAYFKAQRQFHPDKLIGKSSAERAGAISLSMHINEAYECLKSPLSRARHILALNGVLLDAVKPSTPLLMEMMELRETLAGAVTPGALDSFAEEQERGLVETLHGLRQAFAENNLSTATHLTIRLSYLEKLVEEIRRKCKHSRSP